MVKKAEEGEEGSIEWFLAKDGGTDEQKALKRKAWTMMQTGEYHEALDILWKNFPDEYPIPECRAEILPRGGVRGAVSGAGEGA